MQQYPPQHAPPPQYPPPGYPPHGPPPQQPGGGPPSSDARNLVRWGTVLVLVLAFLLAIGTVIAGLSSESLGITMAYVTAGPLGFGLGGFIVALLTKKSPSTGVAVGAPLGCGCMSALSFVSLAVLFFAVIFPAL